MAACHASAREAAQSPEAHARTDQQIEVVGAVKAASQLAEANHLEAARHGHGVDHAAAPHSTRAHKNRPVAVELAATIFQTGHYIGRIGADNVEGVEGAAGGIIGSPGFVPGSSCCFMFGGQGYEMRTYVLPNGDLNVGTIFPID